MKKSIFALALGVLLSVGLMAQEADYRPGLFFREDWSEEPKHSDIPLAQKHVSNSDLSVHMFGAIDSLSKSHHDKPVDDPYYVWSGYARGNWMVSLQHHSKNVDLSGYAKIKWRTKQAGIRQLHITLKLADGTWLVSDWGDGASKDWRISEINLSDIHWYTLDMGRLSEMVIVEDPDLSNVEEIGFTDMMPGGRWFACSRLDWIEVYGESVVRSSHSKMIMEVNPGGTPLPIWPIRHLLQPIQPDLRGKAISLSLVTAHNDSYSHYREEENQWIP